MKHITQQLTTNGSSMAVESRLRDLARGLATESDRSSGAYRKAALAMARKLARARTSGGTGADLLEQALVLANSIEEFIERTRQEFERARQVTALAMALGEADDSDVLA